MLGLPPRVRIFLATSPCDMRKQFDGLANAVREQLDGDPDDGHMYIFLNRRRYLLKILFLDSGGYCLLAKRLERSRFRVPQVANGARQVEMTSEELAVLLSGEPVKQKGTKGSFAWATTSATRGHGQR